MNTIYEQAGIAAFLAGMRRAREILDGEIGEMEGRLATLQETGYRAKHAKQTVWTVTAEQEEPPKPSPQQAMWTPERRAAASKRMKKLRATGRIDPNKNRRKQPKKKPTKPPVTEVDGRLTVQGLANALGLTWNSVSSLLQAKGIKGKKVIHPTSKGVRVFVYPPDTLKRLQAKRSRETVTGTVNKNHWQTANHPRNPDHPKHEQYRQAQRDAAARRKAMLAGHPQQKVNGVAVA